MHIVLCPEKQLKKYSTRHCSGGDFQKLFIWNLTRSTQMTINISNQQLPRSSQLVGWRVSTLFFFFLFLFFFKLQTNIAKCMPETAACVRVTRPTHGPACRRTCLRFSWRLTGRACREKSALLYNADIDFRLFVSNCAVKCRMCGYVSKKLHL